MATKSVTKISDKMIKVSESFTVYQYDNGFMFDIGGRDKKGEYVSAKILCANIDEVVKLMREASEMELDV